MNAMEMFQSQNGCRQFQIADVETARYCLPHSPHHRAVTQSHSTPAEQLQMSDLTPFWALWRRLRKKVIGQLRNPELEPSQLLYWHLRRLFPSIRLHDSLILSSQLRIILICFEKMYFLSCCNMQNLIFAVVSQWSQRPWNVPHKLWVNSIIIFCSDFYLLCSIHRSFQLLC